MSPCLSQSSPTRFTRDDGCKWVKDEPDNRILECALAARAEAIVTGDRALLALREFGGVRIIRLRDYLEAE